MTYDDWRCTPPDDSDPRYDDEDEVPSTVSTPCVPRKVYIRLDGTWKGRPVYRAFDKDGAPLHLGALTHDELVDRVRYEYPEAEVV